MRRESRERVPARFYSRASSPASMSCSRAHSPASTRLFLWWCFFCALLLGAACRPTIQPATEVIVVVRAESSELAGQIALVRARLYPLGAKTADQAIEDRMFQIGDDASKGEQSFPFSFGIAKGNANRFLLMVSGYGHDDLTTPVIERKLIASFQPQQSIAIDVVLATACFGNGECRYDLNLTCDPAIGRCSDVPEVSGRKIRPGDEIGAVWGDAGPVTPMKGDKSDASVGAMDEAGTEAGEAGPGSDPDPQTDGGIDPSLDPDQMLAMAAERRLRICEIIVGKPYNIGEVVDDYDRCLVNCIINQDYTCEDLKTSLCNFIASPFSTCQYACDRHPADGFVCDDKIIAHHYVCDDLPTCEDGTDEVGCKKFKCEDGTQSVSERRHCDGIFDCADMTDEKGCGRLCP